MFDSTMKTMAIPERVFALCQVLKGGTISEEDAQKIQSKIDFLKFVTR